MAELGIGQVRGDVFNLKVSDSRHYAGENAGADKTKNFGGMLFDAMNEVNTKQQNYADLSVKAVTDPRSVDPHDITIAGAEANLSLNIAKNVIDRVIRAYRDITTLR